MADGGSITIRAILDAKDAQKGAKDLANALKKIDSGAFKQVDSDAKSAGDSLQSAAKSAQDAGDRTDKAGDKAKSAGTKFKGAGDDTRGAGEDADKAASSFERLAGRLQTVGAVASVGITAPVLAAGAAAYTCAMDYESQTARIQAALGTTREEAERFSEVGQGIYEQGWGQSLSQVNDVLLTTKQLLGDISDEDLGLVTESVMAWEQALGADTQESVRGINALMEGFGLSAEEATDLMAAGMQRGLNYTQELGDNLAEYSGRWGDAGMSASEYFSLLEAGADNGAYKLDKVGDFLNEFLTSLNDGRMDEGISNFSQGTQDIFNAFKDGKATAQDVLNAVIGELNNMESATDRARIASELWSTLGEDNAWGMIGALADVTDSYTDVTGAAEEFNSTLEQSPAQKMQGALRELVGSLEPLVDPLVRISGELADMIGDFAEWFASLDEGAQNAVVALGLVAAAAGPVSSGIGGVMDIVGELTGVLGDAGDKSKETAKGLGELDGAGGKASKALGLVKSAAGGLAGVLAGIALTVLISELADYVQHLEDVEQATDGLRDSTGSMADAFEATTMDGAKRGAEDYADSLSDLDERIEEATAKQAELAETISEIYGEAGTTMGQLENYASVIDELAGRSDLSSQDVARLETALRNVNELCGTNYSVVQDAGGAYQVMSDGATVAKDAILQLIDAQKLQMQLEASGEARKEAYKGYSEAVTNAVDAENAYNAALEGREEKIKRTAAVLGGDYAEATRQVDEEIERQRQTMEEANGTLEAREETLRALEGDELLYQQAVDAGTDSIIGAIAENLRFTETLKSLGKSSSDFATDMDNAGVAAADFKNLSEEQLRGLAEAYDGSFTSIAGLLGEYGVAMDEAAAASELMAESTEKWDAEPVAEALSNVGISAEDFSEGLANAGLSFEDFKSIQDKDLATLIENYDGSFGQISAILESWGYDLSTASERMAEFIAANDELAPAFEGNQELLNGFAEAISELGYSTEDLGSITGEQLEQILEGWDGTASGLVERLAEFAPQLQEAGQQAAQAWYEGFSSDDTRAAIDEAISALGYTSVEQFQGLAETFGIEGESAIAAFAAAVSNGSVDVNAAVEALKNGATVTFDAVTGQFQITGANAASAADSAIANGSTGGASSLASKENSSFKGSLYFDPNDAVGTMNSNIAAASTEGATSLGLRLNEALNTSLGNIGDIDVAGILQPPLYSAETAANEGGTNIGSGVEGGITGQLGAVQAAVAAMGATVSVLNAYAGQAYSYGSHLGSNFAQGIRSQIGNISAAASEAAAAAAALKFSVPTEGPWSGAERGGERSGEHLVENFAQGMLNSMGAINDAALLLAENTYSRVEAISERIKKEGVEVGTVWSNGILLAMVDGLEGQELADRIWGQIAPEVKAEGHVRPTTGNVYDSMQVLEAWGYDLDKYADAVDDFAEKRAEWDEKLAGEMSDSDWKSYNEWLAEYNDFQSMVGQLTASEEQMREWQALYNIKKAAISGLDQAEGATSALERMMSKTGVVYSKYFVEQVMDGSEDAYEAMEQMADMSAEEIQKLIDSYDDLGRAQREEEINMRSLYVNSLRYTDMDDAEDQLLDFREVCLDVKEAIYSDDSLHSAFDKMGVTVEEFALGLQEAGYTMEDFTDYWNDMVSSVSDGFNEMSRDGQTGLEKWWKTLYNNITEAEAWDRNLKSVFSRIGGEGAEAFKQAVLEGGFGQWGQVIAELAHSDTATVQAAVDLYWEAVQTGAETGLSSFAVMNPGLQMMVTTSQGVAEGEIELKDQLAATLLNGKTLAMGNTSQYFDVGKAIGEQIADGVMASASQVQSAIDYVAALQPTTMPMAMPVSTTKASSAISGGTSFGDALGDIIGSIDWYATGGIFDKAAIIGVGEAGPEAVVPLNASGMAPIADAVVQRMGDSNTYNNNVTLNANVRSLADGRRTARLVGKYTNRAARARGRKRA